jgi:hypothetical protein
MTTLIASSGNEGVRSIRKGILMTTSLNSVFFTEVLMLMKSIFSLVF